MSGRTTNGGRSAGGSVWGPPGEDAGVVSDRRRHWGDVYGRRSVTEVSWFQREPAVSLELIAAAARPRRGEP